MASFVISRYDPRMATMNISLPDAMKAFVDEQVANEGYASSSEYIRELIRRERQHAHLRRLLQEALESEPVGEFDDAYFEDLERRISEPDDR